MKKLLKDGFSLWEKDNVFHKMIKEIEEMDRKTTKKKKELWKISEAQLYRKLSVHH